MIPDAWIFSSREGARDSHLDRRALPLPLHHPPMAEPLLGGTGTLLYEALDRHADGTISRDELPGLFSQAVLAQPALQALVAIAVGVTVPPPGGADPPAELT